MNGGRTGYRAGMDVRRVAVPVAAALVSALLAGCGSGEEAISNSAADSLHSQVEAVRKAVTEDRTPAAKAAVAELREAIRDLASSRQLNAEDALVLLAQVDRIATQVDKPATSTPTPTPKPTPVPVSDSGNGEDDDKGEEAGNGNGNGKAEGKGKGKDK